jgi:hypothetical protein
MLSRITRRALFSSVPAALCLGRLKAVEPASQSSPVDRLLDEIVANEQKVLKTLSARTPIVETYIQENLSGAASSKARDDYFLGRVGLVHAIDYVSFVHRQSAPPPIVETRTVSRFLFLRKTIATETVPEHIVFLPAGFAQMAVIDGTSFDRKTYEFDYVRREFLGDVRCFVFDIRPAADDPGRFVGRIWVDDETHFVVRANGTYTKKNDDDLYFHFDSWRVNPAPGIWIPAVIYTEDAVSFNGGDAFAADDSAVRFKAQTRLWGYDSPTHNRMEELTAILVDAGHNVQDASQPKQISPLEGERRWEREAEQNVVDRLVRIGLIAPAGDVDQVLDTVVNNLQATNNLDLDVHCRLLLTTPLETFTIGHSIAISRGLVDVLPDEASLALVLATELSHIALGHPTRTEYAFNDREMVGDEEVLERFRFARTPQEIASASKKAIALLQNSPYKDKMAKAGLFLRALKARTARLKCLIRPTFGNGLTAYLDMPEFQQLLAKAPPLDEKKLDQIAALPLGSRVRVEPWDNRAFLMKPRSVALLSPREKMPFEVAPVSLYLTRAKDASVGK